jgi:hypothetical protein
MSDAATFFLVWNPKRSAPTYQHASYESALRESERLARMSPGQDFFILQAVSRTKKQDVETIRLEPVQQLDDQIPF